MDQGNAALMDSYIHAWVDDDHARAMTFFSPDVVVHIPGRNPLSGVYRGLDGFCRYRQRLLELTDGILLETVEAVVTGEDHAVAIVHDRALRGSRTLALTRLIVYHLAGGRITEAFVHEADQHALDAFLSEEQP